jgi:hypothetical protein
MHPFVDINGALTTAADAGSVWKACVTWLEADGGAALVGSACASDGMASAQASRSVEVVFMRQFLSLPRQFIKQINAGPDEGVHLNFCGWYRAGESTCVYHSFINTLL